MKPTEQELRQLQAIPDEVWKTTPPSDLSEMLNIDSGLINQYKYSHKKPLYSSPGSIKGYKKDLSLELSMVVQDFMNEFMECKEEQGLTMKEIEKRCGVSERVVSKLKNGDSYRLNPTIETFCRLADAVGMRVVVCLMEKDG